MKVIALVTLIGGDRKPVAPGTEVALDDSEAQSLLARGLATLPPAGKKPAASPADKKLPAEAGEAGEP